ncbi:MAG: PEP-CTERM sorting domain-containing protein, partial [Kiritimatiellales bacterium]
ESMTLTFDFNAVAALSGNPTLILNQGATIGVQLLLFDQTAHTMRFNNGTGLADVSTYVLNESLWYRIEITIADMSTGTDTFNIRVWEEDGGSGALVINETGLNFRNNVTGINSVDFGGYVGANSSRVRFMLDNVTVAVPEPASVGLFSVGCLGALAVRRVSFR